MTYMPRTALDWTVEDFRELYANDVYPVSYNYKRTRSYHTLSYVIRPGLRVIVLRDREDPTKKRFSFDKIKGENTRRTGSMASTLTEAIEMLDWDLRLPIDEEKEAQLTYFQSEDLKIAAIAGYHDTVSECIRDILVDKGRTKVFEALKNGWNELRYVANLSGQPVFIKLVVSLGKIAKEKGNNGWLKPLNKLRSFLELMLEQASHDDFDKAPFSKLVEGIELDDMWAKANVEDRDPRGFF